MLEKIRKRILKVSNIELYARNNNIRPATLYDFLNNRVDIRFSTLMKIIEPLGMGICDKIPYRLYETDYMINENSKRIKSYDGKKVTLCFRGDSIQGAILGGGDGGKFELVIIGVD